MGILGKVLDLSEDTDPGERTYSPVRVWVGE